MSLSIPELLAKIPNSWKKRNSSFITVPFPSPEMIDTPEWAEWNDKYLHVAHRLPYENPKLIMVEYKPKDTDAEFPNGYSKFYVVGADGNPVPYNERIWEELHKQTSTQTNKNYDVDSKGRVTMLGMSIPAVEANIVAMDIVEMNSLWSKYPTAKDYDTVQKLHANQLAIDKLKSEDKYKRIDSQIKAAQESIKAEQERIAKLEKDLNKVYEDAADAMNYFEEQGIAPDMEGDGETRKSVDIGTSHQAIGSIDFASMYPGITSPNSSHSTFTGITFKGTGNIMELPNSGGQATVVPDIGANFIREGDFIIDTHTGKQAVYGTDKKWYIVSS